MSSAKGKLTKKTIYLDPEEEITGIIDKMRSAKEPIVALVVPKSASVFTSIVNLKLLKRAASQGKKRVVLITSSEGVLPLAGIVGIHVASNLNSKPYIPNKPEVTKSSKTDKAEEVIAVTAPSHDAGDDSDEVPEKQTKKTKSKEQPESKSPVSKKYAKKLKVPNFKKFRILLFVGLVLLLGLVGFGYWALAIAPQATVDIRGKTDKKELIFKVNADTSANKLKHDKAVVPSTVKEIKKTETERVQATGEKNKGNKASGTVTLKNCSRSDGSVDIPAGTTISVGQLNYLTQERVKLEPSLFSGGGFCLSGSKDVQVIAEEGGEKYNSGSNDYSVSGFSGVQAEGDDMSGGTDEIVKVVSESDVDKAKLQLEEKTVGSTEELKAALRAEGYIPVEDTYTSTPSEYSVTPEVDSEAGEVAVSTEVTYTMLGIKESDLEKMIEFNADQQDDVDTTVQSILNNGLNKAKFQLGSSQGAVTEVNITTIVTVGPDIDEDLVKTEVAGRKTGEAENILSGRPGIDNVTVVTEPFWVESIPTNPEKITVNIEGTDD